MANVGRKQWIHFNITLTLFEFVNFKNESMCNNDISNVFILSGFLLIVVTVTKYVRMILKFYKFRSMVFLECKK